MSADCAPLSCLFWLNLITALAFVAAPVRAGGKPLPVMPVEVMPVVVMPVVVMPVVVRGPIC